MKVLNSIIEYIKRDFPKAYDEISRYPSGYAYLRFISDMKELIAKEMEVSPDCINNGHIWEHLVSIICRLDKASNLLINAFNGEYFSCFAYFGGNNKPVDLSFETCIFKEIRS